MSAARGAARPLPPLPSPLLAGGVLIFKRLRLPAEGVGRCPGGLGAGVTRAARRSEALLARGSAGTPSPGDHSTSGSLLSGLDAILP